MDKKRFRNAYSSWLKFTQIIKKFEKTANTELSHHSDKQLSKLFDEWDNAHIEFWQKGFLPELSNWGGEKILKNEILKFNKNSFIEIFEKLSAPERFSFFQKEEVEFLKIKLLPRETQKKKLALHQKKYYWLRNNYGFTRVLDVPFFEEELNRIKKKDAEKKLKKILDYPKQVREAKRAVIKKYNIPFKIQKTAKGLSFCLWWQDLRKKFIFISNHIISQFLHEISRRKKIPFKDLCYYTCDEIKFLLKKGKKVNAKKRFNGFLMIYYERKGKEYISGRKARELVKPYITIKIHKNIKEFKGLVVSKGETVKGAVKILLTPRQMSKMKKGDILVAPMTSPDFITAMRKASAIITDEGGMTSHAAIVSRELGIPCIVGTRIATKVLKDGMLVGVDTTKGLVRIIK